MLLRALAADSCLGEAYWRDLMESPQAVRTGLIAFARIIQWQDAGQVRWQDISFEAFRDPQWLLGEAKRLLQLAGQPGALTAAPVP